MKTCPKCQLRYPNDATYCVVDRADLVPSTDERIGTLVAKRYLVEEILGEGGMATVYRARHKNVERPVALKVIQGDLAKDTVVRERFRREAQNARKLAHPNIIEIFDHGETEDGSCFIAMELLSGMSLSEALSRAKMDLSRALPIMVQSAKGIARAHDFDVLHRDIKPENIFLAHTEDGREIVKVLDFGIARSAHDSRLTNQGELFGTPQYMAPERIKGQDAASPSDIYALGIVFYEMLTGGLPFVASDITQFFIKHLNEPAPAPVLKNSKVPAKLNSLVLQMLAKEPEKRPIDAHAVVAELIQIAKSLGIEEETLDPKPSPTGPVTITLPAVALESLLKKGKIVESMLQKAFGTIGNAPPDIKFTWQHVEAHQKKIEDLRNKAVDGQKGIEELSQKGRDTKERIGKMAGDLGQEASAAKEALRISKEALTAAAAECTKLRSQYTHVQRDVLAWEGRSGLREPYPELAEGYRKLASIVDMWILARTDERSAAADVSSKESAVGDLEAQIHGIRAALQSREQELELDLVDREETMRKIESDAARMEVELLTMLSRAIEPLRERADLAPFFSELNAL